MPETEVEARARSVLEAMDAPPETRAAGGRYLRSAAIRPGIRYWATSQARYGQDLVGVQFFGSGMDAGARLRRRLLSSGFLSRTPQKSQITFAKPVGYAADGSVDDAAVKAVKRQIDALLADRTEGRERGRASSFRAFMAGSPLAEVELALPNRSGDWRSDAG